MPRRHVAEDYSAVNELGMRLNMKISCAFVLGEWDSDNSLREIPHLSKYGKKWNNASYFSPKEARRCAEAINRSEYIDINIHGLLHGYYTDGVDNYDKSDFCYTKNGAFHRISEEEIRARLDAFFGLLRRHKLTGRRYNH